MWLDAADIRGGVRGEGGSLFDSVPTGGDAYVLRTLSTILVLNDGRERTAAQCRELLLGGGFTCHVSDQYSEGPPAEVSAGCEGAGGVPSA